MSLAGKQPPARDKDDESSESKQKEKCGAINPSELKDAKMLCIA